MGGRAMGCGLGFVIRLLTETISLRMPAALLETIKIEANKRDVPYQSLIKMALADQFQQHPG